MTVSTLNNRVSYAGNGVTTVFSFPNRFLADADLVVLDVLDSTGVETTKTLTTHYTVSGAGDAAGGSVTMLTAPASGRTLVIYRDPALTQPIDLVNGDLLDVDTGIERGMDRSTLQMQRLRDLMDRSLRLPDGDTGFAAGDMILPAEIDRVGNYLAFDADGKPIASAGTTGTVPVSAFMETVVDDTTAGAVVETLRGNLSAETVTADDDEVLLRDTSATAGKRMTFANFIDRILTVARTFTAAHVHQGAETHSGIETHSNSEEFSGTPSINLTGGQIKFPAVQSASADANTLDDYEEGTFTPTLLFGGAATGIAYSVQDGSYTKIGNMVFINGRVATTTKSSSTGNATIGGLPIAVGVTTSWTLRVGSTVTYSGMLQAYSDAASSVINIQQITEAGTSSTLTDTSFSNIVSLTFSGHYRV